MSLIKGSNVEYHSIKIQLSSTVNVHFHTRLRQWYMTDDGVNWYALPAAVRSAQTAINRACAYYGMGRADNMTS
jgi:hypothetical protein